MAIIYQIHEMGMADLNVALVGHPGEADLCVKRVSSRGLAKGSALWYLCNNQQEAQLSVYICSRGMEDLKICFVSDYGLTGWQNEHRLRHRFNR